jgi:hypothetical protein
MSSKIECTAVNELIDLVQHRPLRRDSAEELFFQPPREANLRATGTQPPPAAKPRALFAVELPMEPTEARATMPVISYRKQVFEPTPRRAEEDLETTYVPRHVLSGDVPTLLKKLALPAGILLMIGIGVGAAVSMTRHKTAAAGTQLDVAAAFTPPKVIIAPPAPVIKAAPALLTVRLESTPPGATATLLDTSNGNSTPLGTTPVEASVDPAKTYDVRFELEGRTAQTEHLDPAQPRIDVALAEPIQVVAPAPVVAEKQHHHHHTATHVAAKRVATATPARTINKTKLATPDFSPSKSSKQDALASLGPAPDKKGSDVPGKVAVSASVPCAILLDGANTGMTSPATLTVAAGHHNIRLIAATQHINKQFAVDVTAKKTTRLDQTF